MIETVYKVFDLEKKFLITPENALEYADKIGAFLQQQLDEIGYDGYVLGISGGLDSAVAAHLCARAGINLYLIMMPYGDTMEKSGSAIRAGKVIANLGLEDHSLLIDIKPACDIADRRRKEYLDKLPNHHAHAEHNLKLAAENRRARQRMIELYDFAQAHNLLVLGTDNLDEHCLGYFTVHGDVGQREPLQFCTKGELRILGRAIGVSEDILTCAPSAELSDGQTDEQDLGFGYNMFDDLALKGTSGSEEVDEKIRQRYKYTQHKREFPAAFNG